MFIGRLGTLRLALLAGISGVFAGSCGETSDGVADEPEGVARRAQGRRVARISPALRAAALRA